MQPLLTCEGTVTDIKQISEIMGLLINNGIGIIHNTKSLHWKQDFAILMWKFYSELHVNAVGIHSANSFWGNVP